MLDNLYTDIGKKIQNWAKWIFIAEAITAVISAFVLMGNSDIFLGLLLLICGPLAAWVSSWILYAFGQLVEDTHAMRTKYYPLQEEAAAKRKAEEEAAQRKAEEAAAKRKAEEAAAKHEAEERARAKAEQEAAQAKPDGEQCELCGNYFNHLTHCKITDQMGTRYRNICNDCMQKHHAQAQ